MTEARKRGSQPPCPPIARRTAALSAFGVLLAGLAMLPVTLAAAQGASQEAASSNAVEVPTIDSPILVPESLRPKPPVVEPPPPPPKVVAKAAAPKKSAKNRAAKPAVDAAAPPVPVETAVVAPPAAAPAPAPIEPTPAEPLAPAGSMEPAFMAGPVDGVADPSAALAPTSADTASWQTDLLAWRTQRERELTAPDGWLTLVGLEWLKTGINSFGAARDNQIQIHAAIPDHLGLLTVMGGAPAGKAHAGASKAARPDPSSAATVIQLLAPREGFPAGFEVDGAPAREGPINVDGPKPTTLTWKGLTMVVLSRGGRFMLRIKDADAPSRTGFKGLKWFDPNPQFRIIAKWTPFTPPHVEKIPTVIGTTLDLPAPGVAEFKLDGKTLRLEPVIEAGEQNQLFFILRDTTSTSTTYGSGRFLHTGLPDHGLAAPGELTLDFNQLYNPPCAYTPYATCPLPPEQNRLSVAIQAGEQRYAP